MFGYSQLSCRVSNAGEKSKANMERFGRIIPGLFIEAGRRAFKRFKKFAYSKM